MKKDLVLMETFKGFEIYYDKERERFISEKSGIKFEARSLWEMKGYIRETNKEVIDKVVFIKTGYSNNRIAKIHLLAVNNSNKTSVYKIISDTENSYDVGKEQEDRDIPKTYEINDVNQRIYDEVKQLNDEMEIIEGKQQNLVLQLK